VTTLARRGILQAAEDLNSPAKSLLPFARILRMMDEQLDWTEQLGNAVLAQQADVMDSIQRLRAAAGTLWSNPLQRVKIMPWLIAGAVVILAVCLW
jgi:hypothetical protein